MNKVISGPIGRKWGYLFGSSINYRTLAHELGHGRMSLHHSFSDLYCGDDTKGTTPNLMDYPSADYPYGTELNLFQWNACHNRAIAGGIFQSDEEGAASDINAQVLAFLQQEGRQLGIDGDIYCIVHTKACPNGVTGFTHNQLYSTTNPEAVIYELNIPGFRIFTYFLTQTGDPSFDIDFEPTEGIPIAAQGLKLIQNNGNIISCENNISTLDALLPCSFEEPDYNVYLPLLIQKASDCFNQYNPFENIKNLTEESIPFEKLSQLNQMLSWESEIIDSEGEIHHSTTAVFIYSDEATTSPTDIQFAESFVS
ncbi:MAG: hypothetical protein JW798_04005 [Prolixibacteraceae bacterium]|nr:hypothetical protein [Prolixibacteraceae bacterium]